MTLAPSHKAPASLPWVLVLAAVAALVVALDQLVVATALQTIHRGLGASMTSLEWTVNAFSLSFAALMIPGAELGDRIGRRRTYIPSLAPDGSFVPHGIHVLEIREGVIARIVVFLDGALFPSFGLPTSLPGSAAS